MTFSLLVWSACTQVTQSPLDQNLPNLQTRFYRELSSGVVTAVYVAALLMCAVVRQSMRQKCSVDRKG